MWVVMGMKTNLTAGIGNVITSLKVEDEYGLIGFLPVYKTKKAAQKYAAGKYKIEKITKTDRSPGKFR